MARVSLMHLMHDYNPTMSGYMNYLYYPICSVTLFFPLIFLREKKECQKLFPFQMKLVMGNYCMIKEVSNYKVILI